ncbi:MAG TPA: ATP-binding cassette domain-containing protein [Candidatus Eisenbergiella merdavium]|uniref:ATP-binding cassette domain-containing protein n=1 Tax=Candidatus Eisenbergiella merdavium TaxID=2838551 RepID=A0A9D2NFA1_9FIRM|nr:ATP-binding cassette domain-containing protein [Candidatus Eisenbergiella merdavium]
MKYAVQTQNLTKQYGKALCVDHIDLKVPEGSIYGFLGPNGAGKSTTMKMLLGLVKPTEGKAQILGQTLNGKNRLNILRETGSLIESPSYYAHLTGRENLQIVCLLKQVPEKRIDEVLRIVRMEKQQNKKAGNYSLGMKQRLGLAAALLGDPKLLLLDEPTNGLDPAGIQEMRELIRSLPGQYGMTVMVSSHLLSEIDQMATHTGIIDRGCLIWQDSLAHLHEHSRKQIRLRTLNNRAAFGFLTSRKIACKLEEDSILFRDLPDEELAALMDGLSQNGIGLLRIEELQQNLEDIFLDLTGRKVSL